MPGQIRATPQNPALGILSGGISSVDQFLSKPFGYNNPVGSIVSGLFGIPALAQVTERMSYGEPLSTGSGMTTRPRPETVEATMNLAPFTPLAARGARAVGRLAGSEINAAMLGERDGLLGAVTPQPMYIAPPKFTINKVDKRRGEDLVNVDISKFEDKFKRNENFYVGEQGAGGIEGRYKRFEEFQKDAPSIEAPSVAVDKNGRVMFGNGRHRYAFYRDQGLEAMPMAMDRESIANAKKFGLIAEDSNKFTYPQQEALNLAQQRATLPISEGGLGLPANNTPMDRAKAMGFDLDLYHGTTNDFPAFSESQRQLIYGTADPAIADIYAKQINRGLNLRNAEPNIIPLKARGNLLETSDFKDGSGGYMRENIAEQLGIEPQRGALKNIQKYGYEGAKVDMEDLGGRQFQYMYPNAENLRSRFAAFDPFRRTAATAALMGVAAPDLLAQPTTLQYSDPFGNPFADTTR